MELQSMSYASKLAASAIAAAISFPAVGAAQELTGAVQLDLNLRAGPGPTFPVVTVIPANANVMIYGCIDAMTWCDVTYGDIRGWAYADYLIYQAAPLPQVPTPPPVIVFEGEAYWNTYYQDQPFFPERDRWLGGAAGAAGGAVLGALVFGPVGAAVGAVVGGAGGAAVGEAITPPENVVAYITEQQAQPVLLQGEVVIGAIVPAEVTLQAIPDYQYAYAFINGQWVLATPESRQIVYIFR
jgi:uncharacterized protein YraI